MLLRETFVRMFYLSSRVAFFTGDVTNSGLHAAFFTFSICDIPDVMGLVSLLKTQPLHVCMYIQYNFQKVVYLLFGPSTYFHSLTNFYKIYIVVLKIFLKFIPNFFDYYLNKDSSILH